MTNNSSRSYNLLRNVTATLIAQVVILLISFVNRTIFIKLLGAEYLGIDGLFGSILTVLSLAELGLGSAIIFNLYKPIADGDTEKAKQYINNCVHEVQSGKSQAEHTGNQVVMITEQMRNIRNMVEDINRVSEIQLNEIKGFEKSIQDMANIIQNDSGIAVHLEGHSESLKMCVDEMSGKMEEFKVN